MAVGLRRLRKYPKKILTTFLLSYMIVLIIPIAIGSIAYFNASHMIEKESNNSRMTMLEQVSSTIDSRLTEIQKMSMEISMHRSVQDFLSVNSPLTPFDRYNVTLVMQDLKAFRNSNRFIQDFFIYYKNSDAIITSDSRYSPDFYYKNLYGYKDVKYEKWMWKLASEEYHNYFKPAADMYHEIWPKRIITYMQSIPVIEFTNPSAVLVVFIDEEKIKSMLDGIAVGGLAYVMDKDNQIMAKSNGSDELILHDHSLLTSENGLIHSRAGKEKMVVTYTTSTETGWKYVSIIPQSIFMQKAIYIKNMTILIVGICFFIGLVIAFFLAYRNSSPIRNVANFLSTWIGGAREENMNELDFIKEMVITAFRKSKQLEETHKQIIKENEEYRDRINKNSDMVRNGLLLKLLKGRVDDFEPVRDLLAFYNVNFSYERFAVMIFHIDDCSRFVKNNSDQEWGLARFVLTSSAEEMANEEFRGYMAELEHDAMALIMNIPQKVGAASADEHMKQIAIRVNDFMAKEFKIVITTGIGCVHDGLESLFNSYQEAVKAMDYKIIKGSSSIISCKEIVDKDKGYYYPIEIELQLINCVKVGDIERARKLLEHIFEENFSNKVMSLKLIKCLFFNVMSTAIKTLDAISVNCTDIFGSDFEPVDRLTGCETISEIYEETMQIYTGICRYINGKKCSHNMQLKDLVMKYIEQHYSDEDLSQTMVADELSVSAPYLSKFFKQETGENMIDYINKLRINKAKELLSNSQLCLTEVAKKVGCSCDKTFIRTFKQYEGVTPGKFRSSIEVSKQG